MTQPRIGLSAPTPQMIEARDFLMLVKTYPVPSKTYGETLCCAAIDTTRGGWVRIFPVNFRALSRDTQFRKWQFIRATYGTARGDNRPESIRIHQETIQAGEWLPPANWSRRRSFVDPLVVPSIEWLRRDNTINGTSLGVLRPLRIDDLLIESADRWDPTSEEERVQLELAWEQSELPRTDLEPIPFRFKYRFHCEDVECVRGHEMVILDWEISQAYRRWRSTYGELGWREAIRRNIAQSGGPREPPHPARIRVRLGQPDRRNGRRFLRPWLRARPDTGPPDGQLLGPVDSVGVIITMANRGDRDPHDEQIAVGLGGGLAATLAGCSWASTIW